MFAPAGQQILELEEAREVHLGLTYSHSERLPCLTRTEAERRLHVWVRSHVGFVPAGRTAAGPHIAGASRHHHTSGVCRAQDETREEKHAHILEA